MSYEVEASRRNGTLTIYHDRRMLLRVSIAREAVDALAAQLGGRPLCITCDWYENNPDYDWQCSYRECERFPNDLACPDGYKPRDSAPSAPKSEPEKDPV